MASSITSRQLLPPPLLPSLDFENNEEEQEEEEEEEEEEEVQLQRQHGRKPAPGFHPTFVDHADEMRKSGNESFLRGEYVKAVDYYSRGLLLNQKHPSEDDDTQKTKELQALLFSNRAATLTRMALQKEERRTSSPSTSRSPSPNSFDFDPSSSSSSSIQEPTTLELLASALADSERCLSLRPSWSKGWIRRGTACLAMKRYREAEDSFRKALEFDSSSILAKQGLREVDTFSRLEKTQQYHKKHFHRQSHEMQIEKPFPSASSSAPSFLLEGFQENLLEDLECVLCMKIYWQPVTTPCGHSFCKGCLLRASDYGGSCPLCRQTLHLGDGLLPTSVALQTLIEKYFPREHAKRKAEVEMEEKTAKKEGSCIPIFLLNSVVLPKANFAMHIYEPRYRLMLRRCLEYQRVFGLSNVRQGSDGSWEPYSVGTLLHISSCNTLPDGRSYIETVGAKRYRILETWEQDGYTMGKVEWIEDEDQEIEEHDPRKREERREVSSFCRTLYNSCTQMVGSGGREREEGDDLDSLRRFLVRAGRIPESDSDLSWWLGEVLPLPLSAKQRLLETKTTLERLTQLQTLLNPATNNANCILM